MIFFVELMLSKDVIAICHSVEVPKEGGEMISTDVRAPFDETRIQK